MGSSRAEFKFAVLLGILLAAGTLKAVTYIVPNDRDLVARADVILVGKALASYPHYNQYGAIVTTAEVEVETVLKGAIAPGQHVLLNEAGGRVGDTAALIPGSPRYDTGKRYLIFAARQGADYRTWGMGLGKFEFRTDPQGRSIVTRGGDGDTIFGLDENAPDEFYRERARLEEPFLAFIRGNVQKRTDVSPDYFVATAPASPAAQPSASSDSRLVPAVNALRSDYLWTGNYRWSTSSATIVVNGTQPGFDGPGGVQSALSNWNSGGGSFNYVYGGVDASATGGIQGFGGGHADGKNCVLLNDPNGAFAAEGFPAGVVAYGGISVASGTYMLGGETFFGTQEVDVVVAPSSSFPGGLNQATFIGIVTHELGHTLGFRHSDGTGNPQSPQNGMPCTAPLPCAGTGQAIMASVIAFNLSSLQQWDRDAVSTVYGSGPVCNAPSISAQPQSITINQGSNTTLSVTATGTSLGYQWYTGSSPNTASPIPGATSSSYTITNAQTTTSYWVQVTSGCGATAANSNTATVTVTPVCPAISITAQPQSTVISSGGSAMLSVTASGGTGLTYQWYRGSMNDTSNPIAGATSSALSVSPTTDTSYWVRISNSCGSVGISQTATVTICVGPAITFQPQDQSIISGQSANLVIGVQGTSPITITWYRGFKPDTSTAIATGANVSTPVLTANATFWARALNLCGQVDSNNATITVGPCNAPAVTSVNASSTSVTPTSPPVTLSVVATGTGLSYQWYVGASGNTSSPVASGNAAIIMVQPQVTTSYWVRVTSGCGAPSADSAAIVITVGTCTSPSITTQPASVSIASGGTATLRVTATGTAPLQYQWYEGASTSDTSKPLGASLDFFTTPVLTANRSYWVQITNSCGTVKSNVITVSPYRRRSVKHF